MILFLQQVLNGIANGSVYALVALGLTLVYGILHIPNFAHGAFYMVGAYASFYMSSALGLNFWLAMAVSAAVVALISVASERLIYTPLRHAPPLHDMIAAIGLMLFLEAVIQAIFGASFRRLPSPYPQMVRFLDMAVPAHRLLIVGAAFAVMAGLYLFLKRTVTGSTIVAMAQNREGAALCGINARKVLMLTFAISGALAAVAATIFVPINLIFPTMGHLVIMKAFVIIILGGMGSIPGAIVGAMILGCAESLGAFYFSNDYKDIIAFMLLVAILSLRPQGLFQRGIH